MIAFLHQTPHSSRYIHICGLESIVPVRYEKDAPPPIVSGFTLRGNAVYVYGLCGLLERKIRTLGKSFCSQFVKPKVIA